MDPDERWDADTALKSKWIKSISELLIADITESKSEDKCKEIAISSLRALRNFKRPNDAKKMKTAAHAIIANLLLKEDQKKVITKIYKIMDKSGEGHINKEEIFDGYNNIVGKIVGEDKITMEEAEEIIK